MAAVTGQVGDQTNASGSGVFGFTAPSGNKRTTAGLPIEGCYIGVRAAGTYAAGDGFSLANANTPIQNSRKDGKTVAVLDACFAHPGLYSGSQIGAKTVATSGNTITGLFTTGDMSTEWANGTMTAANFSQLVWLYVTYTIADAT
jgi:hypothetical protein